MRIRDLDLLRDINILYNHKIILYGAGDYGKRACKLLEQLNIPVFGICDSNEEKWGQTINGCRILSIQELLCAAKSEDIIIIVAIANPCLVEDVLHTLDGCGLQDTACYTYFALKYTVEFHINDERIPESYRENFRIARKLYNENVYGDRMNLIRAFIWKRALYDMVLVLTPRKVGTTSVARSLIQSSVYTIQTDRLMPGDWTNEKVADKEETIRLFRNGKGIKVISLIRDPIARALSDYFYGLDIEGYARAYLPVRPDIFQGVTDFMEEEIQTGSHGAVFEWFDREIRGSFGIDIWAHDFDKEKGYTIIRKDNIELLLIKMEKLNDCQSVIGQFAGAENFSLAKENAGSERLYHFAYNEFKKAFRVPQHILDFYYKENKAMDYFYTEEEKKKFMKKWS